MNKKLDIKKLVEKKDKAEAYFCLDMDEIIEQIQDKKIIEKLNEVRQHFNDFKTSQTAIFFEAIDACQKMYMCQTEYNEYNGIIN